MLNIRFWDVARAKTAYSLVKNLAQVFELFYYPGTALAGGQERESFPADRLPFGIIYSADNKVADYYNRALLEIFDSAESGEGERKVRAFTSELLDMVRDDPHLTTREFTVNVDGKRRSVVVNSIVVEGVDQQLILIPH